MYNKEEYNMDEDWEGYWDEEEEENLDLIIEKIILECKYKGGDILDLSGLGLSNVPIQIRMLNSLAWLNLSENNLSSLPDWFYEIESLIFLDISYNQFKDLPIRLFFMKNIYRLDVGRNKLSKMKYWEIENRSLKVLDLSYNGIRSMPKNILSFPNLVRLVFRGNYLKSIPSWLSKLKNLRSIDLTKNYYNHFPYISELKNLRNILIGENKLISIPSWIDTFKLLENFDLHDNNLKVLPKEISNLQNLKRIKISGNKFKKIPKEFKLISSLEYVDISNNLIKRINFDFPEVKKNILNNNRIKNIEPLLPFTQEGRLEIVWKPIFETCNGEINIQNNPLSNPPIQIAEKGNAAILNYFRQLEEEKGQEDYLFETKLLIIGEAGSGKTTFARRIKTPDADMPGKGDSTHGIEVDRWEFDISANTIKELNHKGATFHANLWDFGGQEVYHGTHQFFFSKKCMYVLLADTREQKTDFRYWLNTVEQLCGEEATLFVLFNQREGHDWQVDAGFRKRFKEILKEEYTIDLSIVESIPELQRRIKKHLRGLPEVGQKLIQSWVDIRNDLAKESVNQISFDKFKEICARHKRIREDDIAAISGYFTRIGVFTHYIDDPVLMDRIYLNSNRLVKTVYQLLDDATVKAKKGRVAKTEIEAVWESQGFEKKKLPRLLEKFGLMYQAGRNQYIVPEHLPDDRPYEHWPEANQELQLHFRYEFDKYMPKGLMSRLIVALHEKIKDHSLVWRRGVNLYHNGARSEITESLGGTNRFDIRIAGSFRRDLLVIITDAFDKLLSDFKKLIVIRGVKCPCEECAVDAEPFFHKMEKIENAILKYAKSNLEVKCDKSYETIKVVELLGMVNYEWVLNKVRERDSQERVYSKINELVNIVEKKVIPKINKIDKTTRKTNEAVKQINKRLDKLYDSLIAEIDLFKGDFFDSKNEQKIYFEKIEKLFLESDKNKELTKWYDQPLKQKLKITLKLPFDIIKYEAEMDVSNFGRPKNWKEFKRWFLKDVSEPTKLI